MPAAAATATFDSEYTGESAFAKWTTQPYYAYVGAIIACDLALGTTRTAVRN